MDKVSLLWPEHREGFRRSVFVLSDAAVEDLRINEIAEDILDVLRTLPTEVTLASVNKTRFTSTSFLQKTIELMGNSDTRQLDLSDR